MTAKLSGGEAADAPSADLSDYDQKLMTAVVQEAELTGKHVTPLVVPTNNPVHAILRAAAELQAQEVVLGASNKYTAEEQLDLISLYWLTLHAGELTPLTVRIVGRSRDLSFDIGGGNRIPTITDRRARTVAELRAARVGVNRVLLVHDGSLFGHDLFQSVLTMLDEQVQLTVVHIPSFGTPPNGQNLIHQARERVERLHRPVDFLDLDDDPGPKLVRLAAEGGCDLIIYGEPEPPPPDVEAPTVDWTAHLRAATPCRILVAPRLLPLGVKDE
jgi:nucleotide-binding universal stress UspA family protein